jgi:energy-coupling factor transporter ATP-binding protein EcfA2
VRDAAKRANADDDIRSYSDYRDSSQIQEDVKLYREAVQNWESKKEEAWNDAFLQLMGRLYAEASVEHEKKLAEYDKQLAFDELIMPRPVPDHFRAEHTHILGPSGSGKTTLLQQLILDDLAKPDPPGMVIIDPKGLMVERIQSLDVFDPDTGRLKDRLLIIDPTCDPPPALNMFHAASKWNRMWSEDQRRRIENQAIEMFSYIFSSTGSALTDKQATPFSYGVRLMFHMESTIHTLIDLMDDPTRTDDAKGPPFSGCKFAPFIGRLDSVSQRFFENEFFSSNYRETRQQIKARIYGVLQHPEFVRMFEARERKLDMLDCLQGRSIVLVNTAMNTMGSKASQLLGRYMIALTLNAAFSRFTIRKDQWHQTHLIIDEFQEFADEQKTSELLRLAREYRLAVTLAHQEMHGAGMSDQLRSAISTNTSVKYSSRPEGIDISYVARDMRCEPEFLTTQTKTATEARFACFVRGFVEHPFKITVPFGNIEREPQMSKEAHARLLEANATLISSATEDRKLASKTQLNVPVPPPDPGLGDPGEPADRWG